MNANDNNASPKSSESVEDELYEYFHHWNYRLFQGKDGMITIGQVYYNANEDPMAWIEDTGMPSNETVEGLIMDIKEMLKASQRPIFQIPKDKK